VCVSSTASSSDENERLTTDSQKEEGGCGCDAPTMNQKEVITKKTY